jgi:muramidase (phage lysozyme)
MPTLTEQDAEGSARLLTFLDLIAYSEATATHPLTKCNGYDVIVSSIYGPAVFTDFSDHPFAHGRATQIVRRDPLLTSTASGRYQLELKWWEAYKVLLKLGDFSARSQDLVAVEQIRERKALPLIAAGKWPDAIAACANIWASFPGNNYRQKGGKTLVQLLGFIDLHQPKTEAA